MENEEIKASDNGTAQLASKPRKPRTKKAATTPEKTDVSIAKASSEAEKSDLTKSGDAQAAEPKKRSPRKKTEKDEEVLSAEENAAASPEDNTAEYLSDASLPQKTDEALDTASFEYKEAKKDETTGVHTEESNIQESEDAASEDTVAALSEEAQEISDAEIREREEPLFKNEDNIDTTSEDKSIEAEDMYSLSFFAENNEEVSEKTEAEKNAVSEEEERQEPYNPDKPRKVDVRFDFVELFVFTLAIVLFITSFVIRHSVVVGGSMEDTLFEGERLIISDLFYTPDYNDIIVFEDYSTNVKTAVVKRVIGLPGDTIKITKNGSIYRNGELLVEEYVYINDKSYQYSPMEITVPEGELFVMGDHRNNSDDSRSFGTIDEDSVLGRVLLRFYPFDRFGTVE